MEGAEAAGAAGIVVEGFSEVAGDFLAREAGAIATPVGEAGFPHAGVDAVAAEEAPGEGGELLDEGSFEGVGGLEVVEVRAEESVEVGRGFGGEDGVAGVRGVGHVGFR
ncbi:MAG: hypothetical protein ACRD96_10160, partial [Bryobacteraceae bacterium]